MAAEIKNRMDGKVQVTEACPNSNLLLENPGYFDTPTAGVEFGKPFVVRVTLAQAASVTTKDDDIFVVPTGWELTLLDVKTYCTTNETGGTTAVGYYPSGGTWAVDGIGMSGALTAATAGTVKGIASNVASSLHTYPTIPAGATVVVARTGTTNCPACVVLMTFMRTTP